MKFKRVGYILLIFFTLVLHTIALSFWLADVKSTTLVESGKGNSEILPDSSLNADKNLIKAFGKEPVKNLNF